MMQRVLWILILSLAGALIGCETQEQPETKTTPHQVVKPEKQEKVEEMANSAIAEAQAVAEEAEKRVDELAKEAQKEIQQDIEVISEKTEEITAKVKDALVPSTAAPKNMVKEEAKSVEAAYPEEIILKASYGNVTFPHGEHIAEMECSTCHEETPVAFDISKDVAHKLCKGCHKDEGAGPTGCKDCHKK